MEPALFRLPSPQATASQRPEFQTPAGILCLTLAVDGRALPEQDAAAFADGRHLVLAWEIPTGRAEVLIARPALALPPGMRVDGAAAAVWRVSADAECVVELAVTWVDDPAPRNRGPESGENLDAQSWTDGHTRVMIGLPDYGSATSYLAEGFRIAHRSARGSRWEAHFVCAWSAEPARDESLWFAVDCTPPRILGDLAPAG